MKAVIALLVVLLLVVPGVLFFLSTPTELDLQPKVSALGASNQVGVLVKNPHGVRSLQVRLEQGGSQTSVKLDQPANRLTFWRKKEAPRTMTVRINANPKQGFHGGPAKLIVETVANDLRAKTDSRTFDVTIQLDPPSVTADAEQHYINQGGCELVTFRVAGDWSEAGVRVGNYTFRSFPMPGAKSENERFSLFAYPWDVSPDTEVVVYARNLAGTEVHSRPWQKIFAKKFRKRDLDINDSFMRKVVEEIDPNSQGSLLERFVRINSQMRKDNNKTLADLRNQSEQKFLWTPPFQQLSNSKVESFFADVRSYMYQGKKVDEQVHLGFDLSKVAHAPVVASNSGKVLYAARLGIYGNCVVVDHGYGLQSIYAHLSEIGVKVGQSVQRGQELGRSGSTGMAGGDHLHFSMQVDGVQINPVEWWDQHWIHDRILSKLPAGAVQR